MLEFADDDSDDPDKKLNPDKVLATQSGSFETDLTVGEILKRSRLQHNLTFDQAEQDLRIKAEYLEALEYNSIERLPGRVYVFGFVRSYAEYLGLDGEKMVALLKKQGGRKVEKVRPVLSRPLPDVEQQAAPGFAVTLISGLSLLAAMIVIGLWTRAEIPQEIPAVPENLKAQLTAPQKPAEEPVIIADPTPDIPGDEVIAPAPVETTSPHPIVLKALQNTWLEIRDANRNVIFSRVLSQGEEYWVPQDQPELFMTLGNAGGLQILVEGQALPMLGNPGQVKRNIPLNTQSLRDLLPKKMP